MCIITRRTKKKTTKKKRNIRNWDSMKLRGLQHFIIFFFPIIFHKNKHTHTHIHVHRDSRYNIRQANGCPFFFVVSNASQRLRVVGGWEGQKELGYRKLIPRGVDKRYMNVPSSISIAIAIAIVIAAIHHHRHDLFQITKKNKSFHLRYTGIASHLVSKPTYALI
ncbi:hypothetical protein DFH27DRAFT_77798 [Peziza echinospora]|nr:hypothetical protein DFH27DRAFT_77798 [Peziza echinospora]